MKSDLYRYIYTLFISDVKNGLKEFKSKGLYKPFNWLFPNPGEKLRASTKATVTVMETWWQGTDIEVITKDNF